MKKSKLAKMSLILALALLLGSVAIAETGNGIDELIAGMSLRDKLTQMMFFSPRTWKEDPESDAPAENIRTLNDATRQYIASHRFGGMLLFAENCGDAEQMVRLVADMQAANQEGGGLPMFIAIDEEGGYVARLSFGTRGVGAMALTATGDPENARAEAKLHGEELRLVGVNMDFAPVMDINYNAANPVIGIRSFGDTAATVSEYGCAFLEGLRDTNTIATLKHFPGHGNTDTDSHTGLPLVNSTREELLANELLPFKAAIEAGADMVMTAHIQFPNVESQTYTSVTTGEEVYIPATMSKTILTDILRGELGFDGVIVSDALEMKAIWDNYAMDDVLTMTINAGVNLLIMPGARQADDLQKIDDMIDRAVALCEDGTIDVSLVDDSVRRILSLKQKYGILDMKDFTVTDAQVAAAVEGCGSAEHRQLAWDSACKALTLLKNENDAFPLKVEAGEKTLVLFTAGTRSGAAAIAGQILEGMDALPEGAALEAMTIEPDTAEACVEAARTADHVLLVSRAWDASCLDPATENGFPVGVVNQVIDDLHAAGRPAIVISAQLPYDAACFPEADAILLAYCSSVTRDVPPAAGEGSAYVPNLPAAICAAFGAVEPQGKLPVNLPAVDAEYHLTDTVLYERQIG